MVQAAWSDAIMSILQASNENVLATSLGFAADCLGISHCVLTIEVDRPLVGSLTHRTGRFSDAWARAYTERGYRTLDPVLAHCRRSTAPLTWSRDLGMPESAAIWELARHHGMAHGLSVSCHGQQGVVSVLSLAQEQPLSDDTEDVIALAQILVNCAHATGSRLLVPMMLEQSVPALSRRERECLSWAARGLTSRQIGLKLHIAEPTVAFHINKLIRKVGVNNRTHAIAVSLALGLLDS